MKTNKTISAAILAINILGIICLIHFAIPFFTHDTTVHRPDAMLPAEAWDDAGMLLTFGLIPLFAVNTAAFMYFKTESKLLRSLWLLPGLLCLLIVISYWSSALK